MKENWAFFISKGERKKNSCKKSINNRPDKENNVVIESTKMVGKNGEEKRSLQELAGKVSWDL